MITGDARTIICKSSTHCHVMVVFSPCKCLPAGVSDEDLILNSSTNTQSSTGHSDGMGHMTKPRLCIVYSQQQSSPIIIVVA